MNELQTQQNTTIGFNNTASFELVLRAAKMLSSSTLVPKDYQGPGGVANCAIALNMASRMGADPLMVLQNLVIVHGRPTWSSQFLIATFNSCGRYSSIKFDFFGDKNTDDYGCRATATELSTGEKMEGPDVTIGLAKVEGWYGRNGSKWKTIPDLMLRYRAAAWFVRTVAPELSMGLHTQDEIVDTVEKEINPIRKSSAIDDLILAPEEAVIDVVTETEEEHTDLKMTIRKCETLSDLARIVHDITPTEKEALKELIRDRQTEIKKAITPEPEVKYQLSDVRAALAGVKELKGLDESLAVLEKFGVKKVSELEPAQYSVVISACDEAV